jgi:hypothetical protein
LFFNHGQQFGQRVIKGVMDPFTGEQVDKGLIIRREGIDRRAVVQNPCAGQGQQFGIAGTGTDEKDFLPGGTGIMNPFLRQRLF